MNVKRIGLDLAKNVFELYGVDEHEQRVLSKTVRRGKLMETFAQLPPCCGRHGGLRQCALLGTGA